MSLYAVKITPTFGYKIGWKQLFKYYQLPPFFVLFDIDCNCILFVTLQYFSCFNLKLVTSHGAYFEEIACFCHTVHNIYIVLDPLICSKEEALYIYGSPRNSSNDKITIVRQIRVFERKKSGWIKEFVNASGMEYWNINRLRIGDYLLFAPLFFPKNL